MTTTDLKYVKYGTKNILLLFAIKRDYLIIFTQNETGSHKAINDRDGLKMHIPAND